jgi:hypothetical protein
MDATAPVVTDGDDNQKDGSVKVSVWDRLGRSASDVSCNGYVVENERSSPVLRSRMPILENSSPPVMAAQGEGTLVASAPMVTGGDDNQKDGSVWVSAWDRLGRSASDVSCNGYVIENERSSPVLRSRMPILENSSPVMETQGEGTPVAMVPLLTSSKIGDCVGRNPCGRIEDVLASLIPCTVPNATSPCPEFNMESEVIVGPEVCSFGPPPLSVAEEGGLPALCSRSVMSPLPLVTASTPLKVYKRRNLKIDIAKRADERELSAGDDPQLDSGPPQAAQVNSYTEDVGQVMLLSSVDKTAPSTMLDCDPVAARRENFIARVSICNRSLLPASAIQKWRPPKPVVESAPRRSRGVAGAEVEFGLTDLPKHTKKKALLH